jgi:hypothetical protein
MTCRKKVRIIMEANSAPQLIPKDEWEWIFVPDPNRLGARCRVNSDGELLYQLFPMSELPNALITADDLKRLGFIFGPHDPPTVFQLIIRRD